MVVGLTFSLAEKVSSSELLSCLAHHDSLALVVV